MKYLSVITISCFLISQAFCQTEATLSFGVLNHGLRVDDTGNGFSGTFIEHSKISSWVSLKIAPWDKRSRFNVEMRLKHKTGSLNSRYGGQAFPKTLQFDYEIYRLDTDFRYRIKMFYPKILFAEVGCFAGFSLKSKLGGKDGGTVLPNSTDEYINNLDAGLSVAFGAKHMFTQRFGMNIQAFGNQSLFKSWNSQLWPMRDLGIGAGVVWQFLKN